MSAKLEISFLVISILLVFGCSDETGDDYQSCGLSSNRLGEYIIVPEGKFTKSHPEPGSGPNQAQDVI